MTDDLVKRLRAVLWSVNGEPNANGNVDETACLEAAARIEALTADCDRLREALWAILACETPNANATVTRMAHLARAALKGESHD